MMSYEKSLKAMAAYQKVSRAANVANDKLSTFEGEMRKLEHQVKVTRLRLDKNPSPQTRKAYDSAVARINNAGGKFARLEKAALKARENSYKAFDKWRSAKGY